MTVKQRQPQRHHIVPRAYLKRFSEDGRHAYAFLRHARAPQLINITKLCVENDYYAIQKNATTETAAIEMALSQREDEQRRFTLDRIPLDLLYPYCDRGAILDPIHTFVTKDAVLLQLLRGRTVRRYVQENIDTISDKMMGRQKECPVAKNIAPLLEKDMRHKASVVGPLVAFIDLSSENVMRDLIHDKACHVLVNMTGMDFITSDEPVVVYNLSDGRHGLFRAPLGDPNTIICYPLDPKHMVILYAAGCRHGSNLSATIRLLGASDKRFVRCINLLQYHQSEYCVVARQKESLMDFSDNPEAG